MNRLAARSEKSTMPAPDEGQGGTLGDRALSHRLASLANNDVSALDALRKHVHCMAKIADTINSLASRSAM